MVWRGVEIVATARGVCLDRLIEYHITMGFLLIYISVNSFRRAVLLTAPRYMTMSSTPPYKLLWGRADGKCKRGGCLALGASERLRLPMTPFESLLPELASTLQLTKQFQSSFSLGSKMRRYMMLPA